jgi:5'-nucleotidase
MTYLLSNDDGIDAPGLAALTAALGSLGIASPVIVAPDRQYSGCGHQVTVDRPIVVDRRDPQHYAISGTPADCIRLALHEFCPKPAWILSGINAGGNLGVDAYMSGTLAAVREGAMHGIPGIAISQYRDRTKPLNWERSTQLTTRVLRDLLAWGCDRGTFWNVNLPHITEEADEPEVVICAASTSPLPIRYQSTPEGYGYQGDYQSREALPGTDVAVCFAGKIAIVQLKV